MMAAVGCLVRGVLAAAVVAALAPGPAWTQEPGAGAVQVEIGVEPAEVTVGDPFRSVLRVRAPAGVEIEYPELASGDSVASIAPVERIATADGGAMAVYSLVAWATGDSLAASVPVRLTERDGTVRIQPVRLRLPVVRSVLPAGDSIVPPQPPRGLFVPAAFGDRSWWWLLLLVLAALIAGAVAYQVLARRRRDEETPTEAEPRSWALSQLERTAAAYGGDAGRAPEVYRRVSWVLRTYVCRVDPAWSPDLTTTELLERLRFARIPPESLESLERLLNAADQVKFAGRRPSPDETEGLLAEARAWVTAFPSAEAAPSRRGRAA